MDVSGRILRAWMPAIHAGMTEVADGKNPVEYWRWRRAMCLFFHALVGERKLMKHFVVSLLFFAPFAIFAVECFLRLRLCRARPSW